MTDQRQSRAEREVSEALHRFYYDHHDSAALHDTLVKIVTDTRVRTFAEIKHTLKDVTANRVSALQKETVIVKDNSFGNNDRIEEVEKLRNYIRGMVVKVNEE